jgi:hypothetical protein
MERGEMLIYDDSGEASDTMQEYMQQFCTHLYKIGKDIPYDIVDNNFFTSQEIRNEKALFFADDDYSNWFFELSKEAKKQDIPLLLGHYFFFGNEDILKNTFNNILEEEEYFNTITTTKYLLTSSIHSCLESIASGNNPVFFKRKDKKEIENLDLIDKYNIPTIEYENLDNLLEKFDLVIQDYPKLKKIEKIDILKIKKDINDTIKKFEKIKPSLEYKF